MKTYRVLLVFGLLLFGCQPLVAQTNEKSAADADAAYQAKDWSKAEPLYESLTQTQPANPRNWYRLGVCLAKTGQSRKAIAAFQTAQSKGAPASMTAYGIAGAYASLGQADKAFEQLAEAMKQGYSQPDQMNEDPDLQALRRDARFDALVEQARHNQAPCDYRAESRQFDFWIGDWNVAATQGGTPAGSKSY